VIFTPHLGASTGEAQQKVAEMIATQMASYLINGIITNAVNFPSVSQEVMNQLRPYLSLAERMGALMGQIHRQPHDITITYSGDVTAYDTRVLTHAVLKGLLGSYTDKPINYVSAPALARDKGIKVDETVRQQTQDYTNLIQLNLSEGESDLNEIWGTIFAKKYLRIVRLGQIHMDAIPEGAMIVIQNHDKPGVIGNIGTTLARRDINIARFQLGRSGGQALCMVNIDTAAGEEIIDDIRALPNIISARQIRLD
jgi:D-3-phosphoglycerate dehydrogenase